MQVDVRVPEPGFDIFNRLKELHLRVGWTDVPYPFRVHEDDVLFTTDEEPENKVRMKIACLEEAYTAPLAQVAEQVDFLFDKEADIVCVKIL